MFTMRESGSAVTRQAHEALTLKATFLEKVLELSDFPAKKEETQKFLTLLISSMAKKDLHLLLRIFHPYLLGSSEVDQILRGYSLFHLLFLYCGNNPSQIEIMMQIMEGIVKKADALLVSETLLDIPNYKDPEETRLLDLARKAGYDFALRSSKLQPRTIHLQSQYKGLFYQVLGPDEKPKNAVILWQNLPSDFAHDKTIVSSFQNKRHYGPHILKVTQQEGHTVTPFVDLLARKFVGISPTQLNRFRPEAIQKVKELLAASSYHGEIDAFQWAVQFAQEPLKIQGSLKFYAQFIPQTLKDLTPHTEHFWLQRLPPLLDAVSAGHAPEKEENLNHLYVFLSRIHWLRYTARQSCSDYTAYQKYFQAVSLDKLDPLRPADLLFLEECYLQEKSRPTSKSLSGQCQPDEEKVQQEAHRLQCTYKQFRFLHAAVTQGSVQAREKAKALLHETLCVEFKRAEGEEKATHDSQELLEALQQAITILGQQSFDAGLKHFTRYLERRKTETRRYGCLSFFFGYSQADYEQRASWGQQLAGAKTEAHKEKILKTALQTLGITRSFRKTSKTSNTTWKKTASSF